jgi:Uma2 family endonuclease
MANPMTSTGTDSPFLPRRMSFEEWAALPEDEPGELVDGFLVEEEVPDYVHEIAIAWLIQTLRNWGSSRGALVAGSGAKFRVTPHRGRMPDLTVYLPGDSKPPKRGLITTPPSIAVEVVSGTVLRKPHLICSWSLNRTGQLQKDPFGEETRPLAARLAGVVDRTRHRQNRRL